MLTFLANNAIPLISISVTIIAGYIYIKFRTIQNSKDIIRVEHKFDEEIKEMKTQQKDDIISVRAELCDVKECLMNTNVQVLNKLDDLAKNVNNIAVDLAYWKGKQSKDS